MISFIDSNGAPGTIDLAKEEEKHIFVFNLMKDIEFKITVKGFIESNFKLKCNVTEEKEESHTIFDS